MQQLLFQAKEGENSFTITNYEFMRREAVA